MDTFDLLPIELLHQIAQFDEPSYFAMVHAYPRFARTITDGIRVDYRIGFGHDTKIIPFDKTPTYAYTRNGLLHRIDGPAVHSDTVYRYLIYGLPHRYGSPAAYYQYDDSTTYVVWYYKGKLHRGPENDPSSSISRSKPAWIGTSIESEYTLTIDYMYFQYGLSSNMNGPADISVSVCKLFNVAICEDKIYYICGEVYDEYWYHLFTMRG